MKRAIFYSRVSTTDQVSTSAQLDELRAQVVDITLHDEIEESKSAKDKKGVYDPIEYMKLRPEFYNKCWLPATKGEYQELWVWKWDRFSRSALQPVLYEMFKEQGVIVMALKDSNEAIVRDIQGVLNKEEIRKIKERVELRHDELVAHKKLINRLPFGYKPVKRIIKGRMRVIRWEINDKEAAIVRQIHASKHKSVKEIAKIVNMPYSTVRDILRNKAYYGIQKYKEKEYICKDYKPILTNAQITSELLQSHPSS